MRENETTVLCGAKVELVPYEALHVKKYHSWMEDEELRELTASERLPLEEEYAMQKEWRDDPKKCTFIVLARRPAEGGSSSDAEPAGEEEETDRMAGDINLFFNDGENPARCELDVMIAEPRFRRRGLAAEAVQLMMRFASERLGAAQFYVKIGDGNDASMSLFRKLGFEAVNYVKAFRETELQFMGSKEAIMAAAAHMVVGTYVRQAARGKPD